MNLGRREHLVAECIQALVDRWEANPVCNYCGCRAIGPIADLTREHVEILRLSFDLRLAAERGDHESAGALLRQLQQVLETHDAVEELALYPAMARQPELADKVGTLFDEHDDLDHVITATVEAVERGGLTEATWRPLLAALETLTEHIDHEEHGVFPAAAVSLDSADWDHAVAVRARMKHRPLGAP